MLRDPTHHRCPPGSPGSPGPGGRHGFLLMAGEKEITITLAPDEAEAMSALHTEFKALWEQQRLMVQDEPTEPSIDEAAVKATKEF